MGFEKTILLHLVWKKIQVKLPLDYSEWIKKYVLKDLKKCRVCKIEGFFPITYVELYCCFDEYYYKGDWHPEKKILCEECIDIGEDFYDLCFEGDYDMRMKILEKKEKWKMNGGYISNWKRMEMKESAILIQRWWRNRSVKYNV